jgi:hypothetical protein
MKQSFIVLCAAILLSSSAYGQALTLDSICLSTDADSLYPLPDSVTISGNCDSITIFMQMGATQIPVGVVKKLNSCSLSVSYMGGMVDTVINYCALGAVTPGPYSHRGTDAGITISGSGSQLQATGPMVSGPDGFVVRLFDQRGRLVETHEQTVPAAGSVSWEIPAVCGALIYIVQVRGKLVAVGQINLVR